MTSSALNGTLERAIAAVGVEPARRLARAHGKTSLHLPARVPLDHHLARLIGFEAAARLVRAFGPGPLYIPAWPDQAPARARQVHEMTAQGRSAREIARALGISERSVRRWRARLR